MPVKKNGGQNGGQSRNDEGTPRKNGGQDGYSHKHRPREDGDREADQGQISAERKAGKEEVKAAIHSIRSELEHIRVR